jgi:hypothetical protein
MFLWSIMLRFTKRKMGIEHYNGSFVNLQKIEP